MGSRSPPVTDAAPPLFSRLWLALVCAVRIIMDAALARRVQRALASAGPSGAPVEAKALPRSAEAPAGDALELLSLFQREGRLVDFLEQEIDGFADAQIGSAARVVHAGCRKALLGHFEIARVREEVEGATITVEAGFDGRSVKLTGDVRGSAPYRGVLRHSGWRVREARLPERAPGHDATIICPAEVEL